MFISDIDNVSKKAGRTALVYLLISLFCLLFGAIYEKFSHNVYSSHMIYAFAYPLIGGTLPFLTASVFGAKRLPCLTSRNLWHCGIATLTVGSIFRGVIEIFGTVSIFSTVYIIAGIMLCVSGITVCIVGLVRNSRSEEQ